MRWPVMATTGLLRSGATPGGDNLRLRQQRLVLRPKQPPQSLTDATGASGRDPERQTHCLAPVLGGLHHVYQPTT